MSKVSIELDCKKYLQVVVQDDHRTTISMSHKDGLELLGRLKAYYEDGEMRENIVAAAAQALLKSMLEEGAERELLNQLLKKTGEEVPSDESDASGQ